MSFDFDVAIVGGGPAGTSTALHLVRRERIDPSRVIVLEKATHPRDKPCAGAVSAWGLAALEAVGAPLEVPYAPMNGVRVLAGSRVGMHVAPLGVVVQRCEFDASLWRLSASDGTAACEGEPVTSLERTGDGWKLRTPRRMVTARLIAACDGTGSTVRKALGIAEPERKGHLYVAETPLGPEDVGPRSGLCDFDLRVADEGIEGYYWDFPIVRDGVPSVSRGIYHANFRPRSDLKRVLSRALEARGVDISQAKVKPFSTRPLVRRTQVALDGLAARGLLLVGEAAGIDATTGEGIAQAILTGAIAAKHLARALCRSDATLCRGYAREVMRAPVGKHLLQSAWMSRRVYGPRGARWRTLLAQSARAREAGVSWYTGRQLAWGLKLRLGISLAVAFATTSGRHPDAVL